MHCGARAAGPCASCHEPVCGNCCTLTEGGSRIWAICLECDRKGGKSLAPAWRGLVFWLLAIVVVMVLIVAALGMIAR